MINRALRKCIFGPADNRSENAAAADAAGADLIGLENFVPDGWWVFVEARGESTTPLPFDDSDASGSP
jgi:hypothetical protein